ncbi:MAG: GGDEF domain-containing protein [Spirochaetaceae bacterium]|nr:GGDEF domain-containing protein [Spirochaetaceae bacterium]MBP5329938.1 GGDEF domain-containing protein [Spirochaetaceae bacterium]
MPKKLRRIGLLTNSLGSEYYIAIEKSVSEFCEKHNCVLLIFVTSQLGKSLGAFNYQNRAIAALIKRQNLDGLIFITSPQANYITQEKLFSYIDSFKPLPVVSLGGEVPGIPSIIADNRSGMEQMMEHLINVHHCTRIALMSVHANSSDVIQRTEVYRKVLERNKIPVNEDWIMYGGYSYPSAYAALSAFYEKHGELPFDAIVALNDEMAYGCMDFCELQDFTVPEIIVTGFDDSERSSCTNPTLSTVSQNLSEQARLAAETLLDVLDKKTVPPVQQVSSLALFRQSCGCLSERDTSVNALTYDGQKIYADIGRIRVLSNEWFEKRTQVKRVLSYFNNNQVMVVLQVLRSKFVSDFKNFDIQSASVCIFENPIETDDFEYFQMPEKARILAAYDVDTDYEFDVTKDSDFFNPKKTMLPDYVNLSFTGRYYILDLYHCETQLGYIIFKPGKWDIIVYEALCSFFASFLSASIDYTRVESETRKLSDSNLILSTISRTDELTQLLNRRGFEIIGQQTIDAAVSTNQTGLVLFGDLDGLKYVNDTYGHKAGDTALREMARILEKTFRVSDITGRMGGDEFAVVATGMKMEQLPEIKDRIEKYCKEFNASSGYDFELGISLGAVIFDEAHKDLKELLINADTEQYEEKRRRKVGRLRDNEK